MKYFVIAGEKSGDMHAGNLCKAIHAGDSNAQIQGWGGQDMIAANVTVLKNYTELAFMGFWEVIKNIRKIFDFLRLVKSQITEFQPDVIVFVDYAGFNLRVAKWAKSKKYKTAYYIAPKAWAWQKSRVFKLKKYVDKLLVIFPFEKAFFEQFHIPTVYVCNPILDQINAFKSSPDFRTNNGLDHRPVIALLPGSRAQEVKYMLNIMSEFSGLYSNYQFVICGVLSLPKECYEEITSQVKIIYNQTYEVLSIAKAAIVTSGTATLETALFRVPQVVVYKTSNFSYQIAKRLIRIKYISLVNLVSDKEVVTELIQDNYSVENLKKCLNLLLKNNNFLENQLINYDELIQKIGKSGASVMAANEIIKLALKK